MVHPLDKHTLSIPSCISRHIQRCPNYRSICDMAQYLTPPQLRQPATSMGYFGETPLNISKLFANNNLIQPKALDRQERVIQH